MRKREHRWIVARSRNRQNDDGAEWTCCSGPHQLRATINLHHADRCLHQLSSVTVNRKVNEAPLNHARAVKLAVLNWRYKRHRWATAVWTIV